jgi:hypothetical protein
MTTTIARDLVWKLALSKAAKEVSHKASVSYVDFLIDYEPNCIFGDTVIGAIPAGDVIASQFIANLGLTKCKKSEATTLVTIGIRSNGAFIIGKHKNYWLK